MNEGVWFSLGGKQQAIVVVVLQKWSLDVVQTDLLGVCVSVCWYVHVGMCVDVCLCLLMYLLVCEYVLMFVSVC